MPIRIELCRHSHSYERACSSSRWGRCENPKWARASGETQTNLSTVRSHNIKLFKRNKKINVEHVAEAEMFVSHSNVIAWALRETTNKSNRVLRASFVVPSCTSNLRSSPGVGFNVLARLLSIARAPDRDFRFFCGRLTRLGQLSRLRTSTTESNWKVLQPENVQQHCAPESLHL